MKFRWFLKSGRVSSSDDSFRMTKATVKEIYENSLTEVDHAHLKLKELEKLRKEE